MTNERAIEILNPEHREHYDNIETVNEACRIGIRAIKELTELKAKFPSIQVGTPLFEIEDYYSDKNKWYVEIGHCSMLQQKADGSWKFRFQRDNGFGSCHDCTLEKLGETIFTDEQEANRKLLELKGL